MAGYARKNEVKTLTFPSIIDVDAIVKSTFVNYQKQEKLISGREENEDEEPGDQARKVEKKDKKKCVTIQ